MAQSQTPELMRDVDQYFADEDIRINRGFSYINGTDLPYIVRPAIEAIHKFQPDAVIAADRGGRPIGFAIMAGWRRRYPEERFPTGDESVQFARVSSRSVSRGGADQAIRAALWRSKVIDDQDSQKTPKGTRVMFVDDWVWKGGTCRLFEEITDELGIKEKNRLIFTMVGEQTHDRHIVGDTRRDTGCSWNNDSWSAGVTYDDHGIRAEPYITSDSRDLRRQIVQATDHYYRRFSDAYTQRKSERQLVRRAR